MADLIIGSCVELDLLAEGGHDLQIVKFWIVAIELKIEAVISFPGMWF